MATIKLGKSLTLVNDATGARYVIQLLYTGCRSPRRPRTFSTRRPTRRLPDPRRNTTARTVSTALRQNRSR